MSRNMSKESNEPSFGRPPLPALNNDGVPIGSRSIEMPLVVLPHVAKEDVVEVVEYWPDQNGATFEVDNNGSPLRGWDVGPPAPYPPTIGAEGQVNSPKKMTEEERLKFPVQQTVNNPRLRMLTLSTATRAEEGRKANLLKLRSKNRHATTKNAGPSTIRSSATGTLSTEMRTDSITTGFSVAHGGDASKSRSLGLAKSDQISAVGDSARVQSAATYRNWPTMDHMGQVTDSVEPLLQVPMKAFYRPVQVAKKAEKERKAAEKRLQREEARKKQSGVGETRLDFALRNAADDLDPELFIGKDASYHLLHYKGIVGSNPAMRALRGGLYMHKLRTTPGRKTHAMMTAMS